MSNIKVRDIVWKPEVRENLTDFFGNNDIGRILAQKSFIRIMVLRNQNASFHWLLKHWYQNSSKKLGLIYVSQIYSAQRCFGWKFQSYEAVKLICVSNMKISCLYSIKWKGYNSSITRAQKSWGRTTVTTELPMTVWMAWAKKANIQHCSQFLIWVL